MRVWAWLCTGVSGYKPMGVCVPCVHCDRFRLNCQAGQAYASGTGEGRLRRPEYGLREPFRAGPGLAGDLSGPYLLGVPDS